jgi:hypothetical protein
VGDTPPITNSSDLVIPNESEESASGGELQIPRFRSG